MTFLADIFGGGQGSQAQGTPTTAGAGDGGKGNAIRGWLASITGAYDAITGAGQRSGPAPNVPPPKPSNNKWLIVGGVVLAAIGLVLLFRK